ncbi:MFS general substrate transporter [Glarea lozoyensis ATCC 20868]|uniref:MFS general substrate transporter n=1 Tax=Glarea lozoyensis (strain ATCC 20868 / MF5171) TaxID=1116229 RepID=S3CEK0_GLAL2|nr:MFS general substrate transporter [Glarea lozoyensis ATCC 20868]EPE24922.1 MFS general substrate transporter [Glarea lozoyensis ATCC 20868]
MKDLIREAPLGQALRFVSGNRLFKYPEEEPNFDIPIQYITQLDPEKGSKPTLSNSNTSNSHAVSDTRSSNTPDSDLEALGIKRTKSRADTQPYSNERFEVEQQLSLERTKTTPIVPKKTSDGIVLVDWYTTDDAANPQNWTSGKRGFVTFLLCAYTWVVYTGSSIYAASEGGVMSQFSVNPTEAVLPLSLYVLAYGIGPLVFAPLSEIPSIGRNPVYYLTFIVFFALSFPTAVVNNFAGLLVLRFLQGFFGSPALANAGASFSDMYSLLYVPYPLSWWVFSAWGGPALGPLMAGFAVAAENWRWSLWEIVWMAAPMLVALLILLPETSTPNILLRRAQRLRKLTGNERLQAQSEIDQKNMKASSILVEALIKPIEITIKDPAIFFVNIYTALFYGIYYTFFEVFPLVFPPMYGFNLGQIGLAFLACQIGATFALLIYFAYLHYYMIPDNITHGLRAQEHRLVPALFGSFLLPIGLFIFGWTANPSIHYVVPLIGVIIFVMGTFFVLQSIFVYVPLSYPQYAASLFAGNDLVRSAMAAGSIVYARPLFVNEGIGRGVSVLAGLSTLGVFGMVGLYVFGARLRARSKFAQA